MKLIGIVVIMLFSVYMGIDFSKKEKQKLDICNEIYLFLENLEYGISKKVALKEIIDGFVRISKPKYLTVVSKDELELKLHKYSKKGICVNACEICVKTLESIGKSPDINLQLRMCSENMLRVKNEYSILEKEIARKNNLYIKLGVVCGATLCIAVL